MRFETREQYELHKLAQRHRAALDAIQPFIRSAVHAECLMMPKIIIHADGRMDRIYCDKDQKIRGEYQALIKQVYESAMKEQP